MTGKPLDPWPNYSCTLFSQVMQYYYVWSFNHTLYELIRTYFSSWENEDKLKSFLKRFDEGFYLKNK